MQWDESRDEVNTWNRAIISIFLSFYPTVDLWDISFITGLGFKSTMKGNGEFLPFELSKKEELCPVSIDALG